MRNNRIIGLVIPALNEENAIGKVLAEVPDWVDHIVVADNGSSDGTPDIAAQHGAIVVHEPQRGYGMACQTGITALPQCDVVVFVDADHSDYPAQMDRLVDPIIHDRADLVIGSRVLGNREAGALTIPQRFGNWLACRLINFFWQTAYTDLGPFRAIRASSLEALAMQDQAFGWTVEMQVKAAQRGLRSIEQPVDYRNRIGFSKISGTIRGVVLAGHAILGTIFKAAWRGRKA